MKLRYTSRALAQLEGLHDYLATRSTVGARSVVASLRATMARHGDQEHSAATIDTRRAKTRAAWLRAAMESVTRPRARSRASRAIGRDLTEGKGPPRLRSLASYL